MILKQTSACFRGLAILMVMASHYAEWMLEASKYPVVREFLCGLGVLGVDIFFLVSGYGLVKSAGERGVGRSFLWNRLSTCYLPYLLVVGMIMFLEGGFRDWGDWKDYLVGSEYWYISVQMVLYICFFVCYGPETVLPEKWKSAWKKVRDILLTVMVIGFTYWLYAMGKADFWFLSNGAFLIGVYIARLESGTYQKETGWLTGIIPYVLIASLFVLGISGFCFHRTSLMRWEAVKSLAFTMSVAMVGLLHDFKSVPLRVLGRYSLYFYLIHGFIYRIVGNGFMGISPMIILFLCLIFTLVIGLTVGPAVEWVMAWITSRGTEYLRKNN